MQLHIESGAAAVASVSSAAGAIAAAQLDMGLPLPDLMAAFAGAALILSFLAPQRDDIGNPLNRRRQIGTIVFCTLGGMWAGPFGAAWLGIDRGSFGALGVPFAMAALGQILVPSIIANREPLIKWALSILPRRGG